MGDHDTFNVTFLNDIRDLHMMSLSTRRTLLCFMQQGVEFTEVWHIISFFPNTLIGNQTDTQRYTAHSGANRLTNPYKYILTPQVTC